MEREYLRWKGTSYEKGAPTAREFLRNGSSCERGVPAGGKNLRKGNTCERGILTERDLPSKGTSCGTGTPVGREYLWEVSTWEGVPTEGTSCRRGLRWTGSTYGKGTPMGGEYLRVHTLRTPLDGVVSRQACYVSLPGLVRRRSLVSKVSVIVVGTSV